MLGTIVGEARGGVSGRGINGKRGRSVEGGESEGEGEGEEGVGGRRGEEEKKKKKKRKIDVRVPERVVSEGVKVVREVLEGMVDVVSEGEES